MASFLASRCAPSRAGRTSSQERKRCPSSTSSREIGAAYPRGMRMSHDYAMEIVGGKMCVFGGVHADSCSRTRNELVRIWHWRNARPYAHDDLWTWDIANEAWRREQLSRNAPCQRTVLYMSAPSASAVVRSLSDILMHHEKLDKVILFRETNSTLPTFDPETQRLLEFTYFADAFTPDQSLTASPVTDPHWKHVLTRGFPTYRSQAKLFCDPETGKIYLFGGYTVVKFVPQRHDPLVEASHAFGDLWQLKLDLPGGHRRSHVPQRSDRGSGVTAADLLDRGRSVEVSAGVYVEGHR